MSKEIARYIKETGNKTETLIIQEDGRVRVRIEYISPTMEDDEELRESLAASGYVLDDIFS